MIDDERIETWIHARIDGELAPADAAQLERALAADARLASLAASLETLERAARGLQPADADEAAVERVLAGVAQRLAAEPPGDAGRAAPALAFGGRWRAAAALVLAGVGAWIWSPGSGSQGPVEDAGSALAVREEAPSAGGGSGAGASSEPATAAVSAVPAPVEASPLALLEQAGAGPLDAAALEGLLDALDERGLGGYRGTELFEALLAGADPASEPALRSAAALLAFDGGPRALRALEDALERPERAALAAGALVAAGPRGAQRLHRRLDDEQLGATAARALVAGGAADLELLIERLDRRPDAALAAALAEADPQTLGELLDRAEPSPALIELAAAARPPGALELLVRAARERETAQPALARLVAWPGPAGLRAVLELLEYGQVERERVELLMRLPEFDAERLVALCEGLDSPSDRRWRAALLGLLVENPIRGSEPALVLLAAADDLPRDQRLLAVLRCVQLDGPLRAPERRALVEFVGSCRRDDARLAACALVALAAREGLDASLAAFSFTREPNRLRAEIEPFSVDAESPRAFTTADVSRVARALEPHLPLAPNTDL